jgi:hypothetical protein
MNKWSESGEQRQDSRTRRGLSRRDLAHEIRIPANSLKAPGKTDFPVSIFLGNHASPQAIIVEADEQSCQPH